MFVICINKLSLKIIKKRNEIVANPIYYIMHFEISTLFVQIEQAT